MYRKKPSGEKVITSHVVWFAEHNMRSLPTARRLIAQSLAYMSEGIDVGAQRALYANHRIALRYTKKGHYSRTVKQLRAEIAQMKR